MSALIFVIAALIAITLFDLLAWALGADSTDGWDGREFDRRRDERWIRGSL